MGRREGMCEVLGLLQGPQQNVEKSLLTRMGEPPEPQHWRERGFCFCAGQQVALAKRGHSLVWACGVFVGPEAQRDCTAPPPWAGEPDCRWHPWL